MHTATAQIKTPDWPRVRGTAARAVSAYRYLIELYPSQAQYYQERLLYWQQIDAYAAKAHAPSPEGEPAQ